MLRTVPQTHLVATITSPMGPAALVLQDLAHSGYGVANDVRGESVGCSILLFQVDNVCSSIY